MMRMSYDHIPFSSSHDSAVYNCSRLAHGVFMIVKNYVFQLSPAIKKNNNNINNNNHENKNKGKEGDKELKSSFL